MKCPKCKLVEMLVKSIENDQITYVCKKCGTTVKKPVPQEEVINIES
jgi:phage FluMu protein Com